MGTHMLHAVLRFGFNASLHHSKTSYTCTCVSGVVMSKYGSGVDGWDFFFKGTICRTLKRLKLLDQPTAVACVCMCASSLLYGCYIPAGFLLVRLAVSPGCGALPLPLSSNKILKQKLLLTWTGPFKILAVGPFFAADTPDGRPLGDKLRYLDLSFKSFWPCYQTPRHCGTLQTLRQPDDIPRHLPAGLTQYVLHAFATKSPPYHFTTDDVSTPPI